MLSQEDKNLIADLKKQIKETAQETRETRNESRKTLMKARALRRADSVMVQYDITAFTKEAVSLRESTKDIGQRERFLAYGYLRGRKYKQLEAKTHTNDWDMKGIISGAARVVLADKTGLDNLKTWWKEDVTRFDIEPQEEIEEVVAG